MSESLATPPTDNASRRAAAESSAVLVTVRALEPMVHYVGSLDTLLAGVGHGAYVAGREAHAALSDLITTLREHLAHRDPGAPDATTHE